MPPVITEQVARKVLNVVDKGLSSGLGIRKPGQMCVEAAVCYALDLPHGDDPGCVSPLLRSLKIRLNDCPWSSKQARAKGLRRLAVAQLGSKGELDEKAFVRMLVDHALCVSTPLALRSAASVQKDPKHKQAMLDAANRCEAEGTRDAAHAARDVAREAKRAADAATYAAATAAADAATYAAAATYAVATAVATAAYADAVATAAYADVATDAATDAATAAATAAVATYVATAAYGKVYDKVLADYAEAVVQMLIKLKAPGCEWLALTEVV